MWTVNTKVKQDKNFVQNAGRNLKHSKGFFLLILWRLEGNENCFWDWLFLASSTPEIVDQIWYFLGFGEKK